MRYTRLIEQNIFYIGSDYLSEEKMPTGDSNTYPRVMEIAAARTKNYAMQLMSLEYALTGKVEFVYRLNVRTGEKTFLGDFELAAAQRTEKVGDDIIVELYIFNGEHCFYKQKIEKVWNEGFQDQWIVEINKQD